MSAKPLRNLNLPNNSKFHSRSELLKGRIPSLLRHEKCLIDEIPNMKNAADQMLTESQTIN